MKILLFSFIKSNVAPRFRSNFDTVPDFFLTTYGFPYDVGSVMHYGPQEFSLSLTRSIRYHFRYALNTSIPVLTARDIRLQSSMGNLDGPSFIDVALINTHYKCARLITFFLNKFCMCSLQRTATLPNHWTVVMVVIPIRGIVQSASESPPLVTLLSPLSDVLLYSVVVIVLVVSLPLFLLVEEFSLLRSFFVVFLFNWMQLKERKKHVHLWFE